MASNSTISISFKIADGADGLKKLTVDAKALRNVMTETVGITTEFEQKVINFTALGTAFGILSR